VLVKETSQEIVLANNTKKITILLTGVAKSKRRLRKTPIVNDNSSNIHRAINVTILTDKDIKKLSLVKVGDSFKKDDLVLLYDDQYVKIAEGNRLLKYKVLKENTVYRRK
jgi:hypothetical protein